jgi:hypothetical protein
VSSRRPITVTVTVANDVAPAEAARRRRRIADLLLGIPERQPATVDDQSPVDEQVEAVSASPTWA